MNWVELPAIKWAMPIPLLIAVAPFVWCVLPQHLARAGRRGAWRSGATSRARGEIDYRPMVALTLVALILTFQEYYGRPDFYVRVLHGVARAPREGAPRLDLSTRRATTSCTCAAGGRLTRVAGYALPLLVWPLFFRRDQPRRLRPARARLPRARLDLRAVRGGDGAGAAAGQPAARLRRLLPDVQAGGAIVARLPAVGDDLPRAVLRPGALLPRLLAARDAQLRRRARSGRWSSPTA